MDMIQLIERIRKEHLHILDERKSLQQLNLDVNEKIDSIIKSMWIIKTQRYVCDKLHVSHIHDPIKLINESNKIQQLDFIMGHQKFGSDEQFLCQMLQHLKDNPKSISYLLFYAEKECSNFLDLLCKIIITTVYNHCFLDQDKLSLIDMMEELIEIYINFHDDLRRHLHNKNSSFNIIYRYFSDELTELKTFYKLALTKPIMLVLSEDNLFLDMDSNRAVMRFCPDERQKHFGTENTDEYRENMKRYKKWTIQKMKYFVNNFIKSLKENIHAFPQSLVSLMIRMYTKLIERFEYQKVNAIFVDMIFFFLICPAIQNPDLFGITDLHVNHIAHYNLMQCAQILQMLALSNWEKVNLPYQEVCDLFDKNCLSFLFEHIFNVAKSTKPQSIELMQLPHFLISDIELKFLLEYIGLFLKQNNQPDNPLNTFFSKLPESILNFQYENNNDGNKHLQQQQQQRVKKSNSIDYTKSFDEFSSLNIKHLLANNGTDWETLKVYFNSKQIFKISNYDFRIRYVGLKSEDKLLNNLKKDIKQNLSHTNETIDKVLNEIDHLFVDLEIQKLVPSKEIIENFSNDENLATNMASLCYFNDGNDEKKNLSNDERQTPVKQDYDDADDSRNASSNDEDQNIHEDESFAEMNMQSLGTLTLQLTGDFNPIEDPVNNSIADNAKKKSNNNSRNNSPDQTHLNTSNESLTSKSNLMGKKVLTGFKSIKDRMKNISLKDNIKLRNNETRASIDDSGDSDGSGTSKKSNLDIFKATEEIFGKYRSKTDIADTSLNISSASNSLLINSDGDSIVSSDQQFSDSLFDIQSKLKQLICTMDVVYIYHQYQFLNLSIKNDFIKFLKILQSKSDDISISVLIMDILRIIQDLNQEEFNEIFKKIEKNWKDRNFYMIYQLKSRQYLLQKLRQLQTVEEQLKKEISSTDFIMISFLTRQILENRDLNIEGLITKFSNPSTLNDEKASLVQQLLNGTINSLQNQLLTEEQLSLFRQILERYLMNRIFLYAFYPNGDIDSMRDQILHQKINQLSLSIDHNSRLLNIPEKYFTTSPWPSAQAELLLLSAYKTPRDKVLCIFRCCSHIITLLSTSQNSIPSADDLLPVLIFVVIKANPRSMLSTIEYINTFYLNDMTGEESYYWTQFCSAVEFIKTILNDQQS